MTEAEKIEVNIRYVAGFSMLPGGESEEGTPVFSVFGLLETPEGDRIASSTVIPEMDRAQTEHLHMQLGKALGIFKEGSDGEVRA